MIEIRQKDQIGDSRGNIRGMTYMLWERRGLIGRDPVDERL